MYFTYLRKSCITSFNTSVGSIIPLVNKYLLIKKFGMAKINFKSFKVTNVKGACLMGLIIIKE